MSDLVYAKAEHRFANLSPEEIYDAWLDEERLRVWMARALEDYGIPPDIRTVSVDPKLGGRFDFADMRKDGLARNWGTYSALDRPNLLEFTWYAEEAEEEDTSLVRIEITPAGDGAVAVVTHAMNAEYEGYIEQTAKGWATMLKTIDSVYGG